MYTKKKSSRAKSVEKGQGLVEYALVLMIAGIMVIGIVNLFDDQVEDVFRRFVNEAPVAPPALMAYTPPPTTAPTATPDPNVCYTLTSNASPNNGGSVNVSPSPNCDGTKYRDGTMVTIAASPENQYQFGGWSGDATGTNPSMTIKMDKNKTVTASFTEFCFAVTMGVFPNNGGEITVSPAPNCANDKYAQGTEVTFSTVPGVGYQFSNWGDDASGADSAVTMTMDSDKRVTANFSLLCYTLTTAVSPNNSGTLDISPAPNCDGDKYTHGTSMVIIATGIGNNQFANWSGDTAGTNSSTVFTMDDNKSVTANFSQVCHTLTTAVSPTNSGSISISPEPNCGDSQYTDNTEVVFTANSSMGYEFSNWSGNATGSSISASVTMNGDKGVTANFSSLCYTLTTAVSPANSGTVSASPAPNCNNGTQYNYGTLVSLTNSPANNYEFENWSGSVSSTNASTTLTMDNNKSVTANYRSSCLTPVNAVSSSNENNSLTPDKAIDGNSNTRWSSNYNDNNWIYVNLGDRYDVTRVILDWETAYGQDYKIQVSDDASSWTDIKSINGGNGGKDDIGSLNGAGQYVRMLGIDRGTQWGYSLWEFDVCGTLAPPAPINLIEANFDTDRDGFAYISGAFGASGNEDAGAYRSSGGRNSTGGLRVELGNKKNGGARSGGWQSPSFTLTSASAVTVEFDYQLDNKKLDSGECSQVLFKIENTANQVIENEIVASCTKSDISWTTYSFDTTTLSADSYTITIGGHLTNTNKDNERARIYIDNVLVKVK